MKWVKNSILTMLLMSSYLLFSYYYFNGWWYSSIGTALILFFSYLLWGKEFLRVTGLKISLKIFNKTVLLALIVTVGSMLLIQHIGSRNQVAIQFTNCRNYYHDIFYILNEEIILGGIPLYLLIRKWKINSLLATAALALFFAAGHYIFYRWIFLQRGTLELVTLTTLFLIGFVRNSLIVINGHIGYSWALHFGWMMVMFGNRLYFVETNISLTEPERFNMFLGSPEMVSISLILAVVSFIYLTGREKRIKKINLSE
jgi:hypothetical protein